MPLKGLTRTEAAWLRRKARVLGSLDTALRCLVAAGRGIEASTRHVQALAAIGRPEKGDAP
jgi:hypothetical protein